MIGCSRTVAALTGTGGGIRTSYSIMKRVDRLKVRKRRKRMAWLKAALAVVLLGGLVVGILNFDTIKTWASEHYLRYRWRETVIEEPGPEEPNLYDQLTEYYDPDELLNILCIGIDRGSVPGEEGYTRSDVMILASIDLEEKRAVLVSIPRDTMVEIPGYGTQKINAAHAFGGPELAIQTVSELSGMDIHHYVEVDFEAFKSIVDAIGGVPFSLEYDIEDDYAGYLDAGDYNLTGEQALIIARSRKLPKGDLDRIENQHELLRAMVEKALTIREVEAMLDILDAVVSYLQTTISPDEIITLAQWMQGMSMDNVEMTTLEGTDKTVGGIWYYVLEENSKDELFRNIRLYCSAESPEQRRLREEELEQEQAAMTDRSSFSLAVLNGVRWEGIAARVAEQMEARGYAGIRTGNTVNPYDETTVYYAPGFEQQALMVAQDLDPSADFRVAEDADVALTWQTEVVLVIGKDYVGS